MTPSIEPTTAAAGRTVLVGPLLLDVPVGWQAVSVGGGLPDFSSACLEPRKPRPEMFGCAGLDVHWNWSTTGYLPGNENVSFVDSPGWYPATDVQQCPVDPKRGPDGLNGVHNPSGPTKSLRPVGDRTADYYQWNADCVSGYRFHPRAWYLPVSKVVMFDRIGYADIDRIVSTARFDDGSWKVGYLTGVRDNGGQVSVDLDEVTWLDGAAAVKYSKAHGGRGQVPDDYVIVDPDTSAVPVALSSDAKVVSAFELANTAPGVLKVVPVARLVSFLSGQASPAHVTVFHVHLNAAGEADYLEEQFRP